MKLLHRTWIRHIAGVVLFAVLAMTMITYTDRVLWDKNGTIMGFYEESQNTIDVIYVGGSHTNAAISPTQLYQEYGMTGYVLYSWSQPIWTTYHYVLEALKTQTPKVVVVDVFGMVYGNTYMTDVDMNSVSDEYSLLIPPSLNRVKLAMAMSRCQTEHKPFYRYASLLQYHNRWKALTIEDILWPLQSFRTTGKGFGPLYTTESFKVQQPSNIAVNGDITYEWSKVYLQKLVDLSKKNGFALVAVNFPYIAEDVEYDIFAWTRQYCEQNDIPFIDYLLQDTIKESEFDYETDMAEHAHVNYKGAAKLTAHLGNFLHENYDLPDHRNDPSYVQWEKDAEIESRNLQDMKLCMTDNLENLLNLAENGDYLVIMAACGDLQMADYSIIEQTMKNHGYNTSCFAQNSAMLWSYTPNGGAKSYQGENTIYVAADDGVVLTASLTEEGCIITAQQGDTEAPTDACRNRPGLNIVITDKSTGRLVYSVSYSTLHDYAAYTE